MNARTHRRAALGAAVMALLVTIVAVNTDLDIRLSDAVYGVAGAWPATHRPGPARLAFYDAPVSLLGLFASYLAAGLVWPRLRQAIRLSRRESVFVLVCLACTPVVIGTLKQLSGVACAYDLVRYGGALADSLGRYPFSGAGAGQCWPAAHPSGAFALLCLGSLPRSRSARTGLWLLALGFGSVLGIYQVARGAHFASHVIVTALIAQSIASIAAYALLAPRSDRYDVQAVHIRS